MNILHNLIEQIVEKLSAIVPDHTEAHQEAWWLLTFITGKSKVMLMTDQNFALTREQELQLWNKIDERVNLHKPLQYIIGTVPFLDLDIIVRPPVLIPRPETEEWAQWVIDQLKPLGKQPLKILDLCSGSGCIALAIAHALPYAEVIGVDILPQAITLAQENAQKNKISSVQFIHSDVYGSINNHKHSFDLIVSNPPYIDEEEWKTLDVQVRQWEDKHALVAAHHGYALYEKIIAQASEYLSTNSIIKKNNLPQLVLEIGYTQGKQVRQIFEKFKFTNIAIHKDLEHKDRWVTASLNA